MENQDFSFMKDIITDYKEKNFFLGEFSVFQKIKIFGWTFLGILVFVFINHVPVVYGNCLLCLRRFAVKRRRNLFEIPLRQESRLPVVGFRFDVAKDSISAVALEPPAPVTSVVFVTDVGTSTSALTIVIVCFP